MNWKTIKQLINAVTAGEREKQMCSSKKQVCSSRLHVIHNNSLLPVSQNIGYCCFWSVMPLPAISGRRHCVCGLSVSAWSCTSSWTRYLMQPDLTRSYSQFSDHCFATAGPTLWNSLPEQLQQPDITFRKFKQSLKTFFMFG